MNNLTIFFIITDLLCGGALFAVAWVFHKRDQNVYCLPLFTLGSLAVLVAVLLFVSETFG